MYIVFRIEIQSKGGGKQIDQIKNDREQRSITCRCMCWPAPPNGGQAYFKGSHPLNKPCVQTCRNKTAIGCDRWASLTLTPTAGNCQLHDEDAASCRTKISERLLKSSCTFKEWHNNSFYCMGCVWLQLCTQPTVLYAVYPSQFRAPVTTHFSGGDWEYTDRGALSTHNNVLPAPYMVMQAQHHLGWGSSYTMAE